MDTEKKLAMIIGIVFILAGLIILGLLLGVAIGYFKIVF